MKVLTDGLLPRFFAALETRWEVRSPVLFPDGTRAIGRPGDSAPALSGGALPGKPTAAFFPQQETVFSADAGGYSVPPPPLRPLFIIGFTPRDLACLRFIDRFFAEGWRDDLYFRPGCGGGWGLRLVRRGRCAHPACERRLRPGVYPG